MLVILFSLFINLYSPESKAVCLSNVADSQKVHYSAVYSSLKGNVTISINHNTLTGYYECYDKWSEKYKEYINISIFYMYGESKDGIHFNITSMSSGDLKEDIGKGTISFTNNRDRVKILFKDSPITGYGFVDFTEDTPDIIFPFKNIIDIKEIRYVKPKKALLYNYVNSQFIARKGYLVGGDLVSIIDIKNAYTKVRYHSRNTDKTTDYWIKSTDLYDANPGLWDK